jgi:ribonuclease Z
MKVTLLGTGTPTNPDRFQSAVLIENGNSVMLFDAGRGAVHQMHQAGTAINSVNPLFITHHHIDHINDLFDVIISSALLGRSHEMKIFGPSGTKEIVRALIEQVYVQDIRFRIEEIKEIRRLGGHFAEEPEAIALVNVRDVGPGVVYESDDCRVTAKYVRHGDFSHVLDFDWRCLGYRIEADDNKVVTVSGDTILCDGIIDLADGADLLIQCCHMPQSKVTNVAMNYLATNILPSSAQVGKIAAQAGVKRMVLTHLSATINQDNYADILADIRQDYGGDVLVGDDLMVLKL